MCISVSLKKQTCYYKSYLRYNIKIFNFANMKYEANKINYFVKTLYLLKIGS
jgi:hypothetical protein